MNGTFSARPVRLGTVLATLAALTALSVSACGGGAPSTANGNTSSSTESNGSGGSSPAALPDASPFDTPSATALVTAVWTSFFSKNTPIAQKETLLENGSTMSGAVQAFASNPLVGQTTAAVQMVAFPTPDKADVTYSISLNGRVAESSMAGVAVYQDGKWLVSDVTLCGLLELAQSMGGSAGAIPGCAD
ncbi:hypothetical protein [Actinospica robiniae]|uniref:hypothetical protein n=1 Tax=Actinospica robiniae TaxID=304901 RepID=UPI000401FC1A|nr:hypothetical protein [Actinospica robiniae]